MPTPPLACCVISGSDSSPRCGAMVVAPTSWGDIVEQEEQERTGHAATHKDIPADLFMVEEREVAGPRRSHQRYDTAGMSWYFVSQSMCTKVGFAFEGWLIMQFTTNHPIRSTIVQLHFLFKPWRFHGMKC